MKFQYIKNRVWGIASIFALTICSSSVLAQEFSAGTDSAQPSGTATIPLAYDSDGNVGQLIVQVTFDNTVLTADLSNCLSDLEEPHASFPFTDCVEVGPGSISITISDAGSAEIVTQSIGTIDFAVDGAATAPSSEPIGIVIQDVTDTGGNTIGTGTVTSVDGSVEIISGPPAVLDVSPASIPFGNVISPGTATETVTIANTGTAGAPDLDVTALTFSDAAFSASGGTCGAPTFSVSAGDSCTVDVEFSAAAVQSYTGDLDVVSSVGTSTVALTGEGTAGPVAAFSITPGTAAFGTVDLSNLPQDIVHTVENTGDAGSTLELTSVTLGGTAEFSLGTDCPASLAQGETCTVTVTFDSAVVGGPFNDTVTAVTNVGTFEVPVSGEAAAQAVLAVNPPFGPVNLGSGPAGSIVSANGALSNTGSADGAVNCTLNDSTGVFSTSPSPISGVNVPAGGSVGFTLACDLPDEASQGDTFSATLDCLSPDDQDFEGTHTLSCGVQEFQVIPVPTMQPWALVLFSMLMLIAGGIGIRFFRAS